MPDFTEDFEALLASWTSTGTPVRSTAGHVSGVRSLTFNWDGTPQAITRTDLADPGDDDEWYSVSFALYVPDWAPYDYAGDQWTPYVADLAPGVFPNTSGGFFLEATSATEGRISVNLNGDIKHSPTIPMGQWVAVRLARKVNTSGGDGCHVQMWVDATDGGLQTHTVGANLANDGLTIGDGDPYDTYPADVTYYVDDVSFLSHGIVDLPSLSGADFTGEEEGGSGGGVDESPGAGRVLIAVGAGPLVANPSWTAFDGIEECRCFGFDWERGRQSEFDVTNTGTARVYFHDRNGTFDSDDFIGLQAMLQLWDPVAESWEPVFRGHIDDVHNSPSPGAPALTNVQMDLVGPFDYVAGVKMVVGLFGETLTTEDGCVKWEECPVNDRIEQLGAAANIDPDMLVVFTGNVDVHMTLYDADDDILSAMRDAADAEFPGIGNIYEDRYGRIVFHGRFAKFDPDGTAEGANWNFQRWQAGTREDVTSGVAQIREFRFNRPRTRIVNTYVAWPELDLGGEAFDPSVIQNNTKSDATSITTYGYRGREAAALIIKQHKTNGNSGLQECALFGDYYVANYAQPRKNIETCTFVSVRPEDPRAAATWALMTQADISDVIHMFVDEAGMSDEEFFIEGISGTCRVANPQYDYVTVTPNLSPAAYYTDNVFEEA